MVVGRRLTGRGRGRPPPLFGARPGWEVRDEKEVVGGRGSNHCRRRVGWTYLFSGKRFVESRERETVWTATSDTGPL